MIEIAGTFNTAKVFNDDLDEATISQITEMCNQPFVKGKKIRIMPDTHAGAGCTIGTTMEVDDYVVPHWVGVDIGCGMSFVRIPQSIGSEIDLEQLDQTIRACVPCGMSIHDKEKTSPQIEQIFNGLNCKETVDVSRAKKSIGTLGGGNHFIELARSVEDGDFYLIVHSGSRHFGLEVATHYQKMACNMAKKWSEQDREKLADVIAALKAQGRQTEIEKAIQTISAQKVKYTEGMEPLTGESIQRYLHDMELVRQFAHINRTEIILTILNGMGLMRERLAQGEVQFMETVHNYIEVIDGEDGVKRGILRKGAVSAKEGEEILIPMNMRDGSLLCIGKGNEDWNCSAPHGAGRILSRAKAKAELSMEEFTKEMQGVYSTSVSEETLDESPMAYKSADDIEKYIEDTVMVKHHLKPIYNFKAS